MIPLLLLARELVDGAVLRAGDQGPRQAVRVVLRSEAEWKAHFPANPGDPRPVPDFKKDMALLVARGQRPSSGYGVEIVRVEKAEGKLVAVVRLKSPAPGGGQLAVLTHPYVVYVIPRSDLPLEFQDEKP
jgi:hypothetical protein